MTPRRSSPVVPVLLAAALVGGAIAWLHRPPKAAEDPLGACPADSFLVARVDVAALRATPLGDFVDQALHGLVPIPQEAEKACDAVAHLDSLAVVVPEGDERSDIGVALKLRLGKDELARCADVLVKTNAEARGSTSAAPEREGAFSLFASGEPHADTLGAADNGLVVLADRAWATAMARAGSGRAPAAASSPPHDAILRALGKRALVVSIALPKSTRARIRREMETELGEGERKAMEGVLGVEAAGAALDVHADTELAFELRCDTTASCAAVNDLLARKRKQWSESPIVRLLGIGQAADALTLTHRGTKLSISTHLDTNALRSAIERALAFRASRAAPRTPTPPTAPVAPSDAGAEGGADAGVDAAR